MAIISGPGSFAVHFGIICGPGSFAVLESFADPYRSSSHNKCLKRKLEISWLYKIPSAELQRVAGVVHVPDAAVIGLVPSAERSSFYRRHWLTSGSGRVFSGSGI